MKAAVVVSRAAFFPKFLRGRTVPSLRILADSPVPSSAMGVDLAGDDVARLKEELHKRMIAQRPRLVERWRGLGASFSWLAWVSRGRAMHRLPQVSPQWKELETCASHKEPSAKCTPLDRLSRVRVITESRSRASRIASRSARRRARPPEQSSTADSTSQATALMQALAPAQRAPMRGLRFRLHCRVPASRSAASRLELVARSFEPLTGRSGARPAGQDRLPQLAHPAPHRCVAPRRSRKTVECNC